MESFIRVTVTFFLLVGYGSQGIFSADDSLSCKYEFTVPPGACNDNNKVLDKTLDTIKSDIDTIRLQYVSQNSQIQSALMQTQTDASAYLTKIRDLQREFLKVKQTVATMPVTATGSGIGAGSGGNSNLDKIVTDLKSLLTQSFLDIQYKVDNITNEYQRMAIEKSKLHSVIEAKITSQELAISSMKQNIADLEKKIKNFNGSTIHPTIGSTSPPISSNMSSFYAKTLSSLKQQFGFMQQEVQKLESKIQNQNQSMQATNQKFEQELTVQANETRYLFSTAQKFDNRIKQTEAFASQVESNVANLTTVFNQSVEKLNQRINATKNRVDNFYANMTQLGKDVNLFKGDNQVTRMILGQLREQIKKLNVMGQSVIQENTQTAGNLTSLMLDMKLLQNVAHPLPGQPMTLIGISSMFTAFKTQAEHDIAKSEQSIRGLNMMLHAMNSTLATKLQPSG